MSHHNSGVHFCKMEKKSISCLPTLSPTAGRFSKLTRFMSKGRLPTFYHRKTEIYFKSEKSLIEERLRLINEAPWYVIHPFSIISMVRDVFMFHSFILDLLVSNILSSFDATPGTKFSFGILEMLNEFCTLAYVLNSICCMVTGYVIENSKSIELRPRKILIRYLRSYALIDLVLILPLTLMFSDTDAAIVAKATFVAIWLRFKSFIPHFTMTLYFIYKVPDAYMEITICGLISLILQHCCTCLSASLWKLVPKEILQQRNSTSLYRFFIQIKHYNWYEQYVSHYHIVLSHFYFAGRGRYGIFTFEESIFYVVIMVIAFVIKVYTFCAAWVLVRQLNRTKIRWVNTIAQFEDFACRNGLNQRLKYRIKAHLEQTYRGKLFKEHEFYASLSEHLRYEVKLQSCIHMASTVGLFKGLTNADMGKIFAKVEPVSFASGEVILNVTDQTGNLFIISRGTVAIYTASGLEIAHLQDGEVLGIVGFFTECQQFTVVTVEFTDTFFITKKKLTKLLEKVPLLADRMLRIANSRENELQNYFRAVGEYRAVNNVREIIEEREQRYQPEQ